MTDKKINTLEVLRCFGFLGVFLCHTKLKLLNCLGSWGVSIFFILNGFLMVYSYYGKKRIKCASVKDNIIFAYGKINRIYLLHIFTMIPFFIRLLVGEQTVDYSVAFIRLIMNVMLINEYIPSSSLNGVAWFLCTLVLSYFLFPWILRFMEQKYNIKKARLLIVICVIIQLLIGIIGNTFSGFSIEHELFDRGLSGWFIYFFPLSRTWDIIIGYNLGYLYINSKHEQSEKVYSILEVFAVSLNIAVIFIVASGTTAISIPSWARSVLIYTIPSCLLIYSFAVGKGKISNIIVCRLTMYIAKISPYGFLIHHVIFVFIAMIYWRLPMIKDPFYFDSTGGCWIKLTVGFVFTVIASELWMRVVNKVVTVKGKIVIDI